MPNINVNISLEEYELLLRYRKEMGYRTWRELLLMTMFRNSKKSKTIVDPNLSV